MTFVSTLCMVALSYCALQDAKGQFANGADIGWLSEMEAQGYVFKDNSGVPRNCLDILKGKGINALRFRVWVNPRGGYCNKAATLGPIPGTKQNRLLGQTTPFPNC